MNGLTTDFYLNLLIAFSLYFVVGIFGAFIKDLYDNFTDKRNKIQLVEIFIGGCLSAFITVGIESYILRYTNINVLLTINFLIGIIGFELFGAIHTIEKMKKFVSDIFIFRRNLKNTDHEEQKNKEDSD